MFVQVCCICWREYGHHTEDGRPGRRESHGVCSRTHELVMMAYAGIDIMEQTEIEELIELLR